MRTASIYCVFIVLASIICEKAFSQTVDMGKVTEDSHEWNQGSILLTDGNTITGLVKLNRKTGVLGYESGATSRSFTARNVISFEYFDAVETRNRKFLAVDYNNAYDKDDNVIAGVPRKKRDESAPGLGTPLFFEILVECKTFALLSTTGLLHVNLSSTTSRNDPVFGPTLINSPTTYKQTETLLIFDDQGTITPLLDITNREADLLLVDDKRTKTKKLNGSIIETSTSPYFEELKEYAKERKLSFKKRDDLIQILEHYKSISSD